jgi:myxalamid-type nonribosomal peptide synthetase MxaA
MPIGKPIANTAIYILDHNLERVGHGRPGEIYIGGKGLARGYVQRPAMTAERFVPNPFGPPVTRLYRTGDIARYLPDGTIEYLGRTDDQVKIRGHRIELGEIEGVLRQQPSIRDAVAIADRDERGEARLVAYVVVAPDRTVDPQADRAALRGLLPDYMVPAFMIGIAEIPVTSNGKLNRALLPAPDTAAQNRTRAFAAPTSETETLLAAIWQEALKQDRIGIDDDFFALGGHSLLATRVVFLIEKRTGIRLKVSDILRHPTIRALADFMDNRSSPESAPAADPGDSRPDILLAKADAVFPATLSFDPARMIEASGDLLLTGATGFVGRYLLAECLRRTTGRVVCLVRVTDDAAAKQRVTDALRAISRWSPDAEARLEIIAGDLAAPRFGLPKAAFEALTHRCGTILHNGAGVNFFAPYADLRLANVLGTLELIAFAGLGRTKAFHHISSLSVFPVGAPALRPYLETDPAPSEPPGHSDGYVLSKWAAERLVQQASVLHLPSAIYRLGLITADAALGVCNPDDLVYRVVRAVADLGAEPVQPWQFKLTPVDAAAEAVVDLVVNAMPNGRTYHIDGAQKISVQDFSERLRRRGRPIRRLSLADWRDELRAAASTGENPNASALYSVIENTGDESAAPAAEAWSSSATLTALTALGFAYRDLGAPHLDATLDFLGAWRSAKPEGR